MNRRRFITAAGFSALSATRVFGANDRIRVGVIGVGNRSNLLIDQLPETGEIVSVADCFLKRANDSRAKRGAQWRVTGDHRRLLDEKDVDGVIVGTMDHTRVLCAIHACQAGKDVYAEKPMTAYLAEGRALVQAARRHNRIVQAGSQQRSMAMNKLACEFVRTGGIGKVLFVEGVNYTGPQPYTPQPEEPVPDTLNWDVWCGPTPLRPYSSKLHLGWMRWRDYSGGEMTNWGAHGLDQIQTALGTDETGPVEWEPLEGYGPGAIAFRYANGVTVRLVMPAGNLNGGAIFVGEKGRIEITRNAFRTDPPDIVKELPAAEEVNKWKDEVAKWQAKYHMQNWLECMRSRSKPLADVEIGHRSVSLSHLANITRELGRKLRWDPAAERFKDDAQANALLTRPRRKGYELPA